MDHKDRGYLLRKIETQNCGYCAKFRLSPHITRRHQKGGTEGANK